MNFHRYCLLVFVFLTLAFAFQSAPIPSWTKVTLDIKVGECAWFTADGLPMNKNNTIVAKYRSINAYKTTYSFGYVNNVSGQWACSDYRKLQAVVGDEWVSETYKTKNEDLTFNRPVELIFNCYQTMYDKRNCTIFIENLSITPGV